MPVLRRPHDHCRGLCPQRRTARPALRRPRDLNLMRLTVFVVPLQHWFAGTSCPRHRARFIPAPANADTTSPTSPQSGHRAPQQRPLRCRQRRLPPWRSPQNHPDYSRSGAIDREALIAFRGFVHRRLSDAAPLPRVYRSRPPASESLTVSGHSAKAGTLWDPQRPRTACADGLRHLCI